MAKVRVRKECFLTADYLDRLVRIIDQCCAEGAAQDAEEDNGSPLFKIEREHFEHVMQKMFKDYKLGGHAEVFASNDSDLFDPTVAVQYLLGFVRHEGKKLLQSAEEECIGTFQGKNPADLEAIGHLAAIDPDIKAGNHTVAHGYADRVAELPDVERTYRDSVSMLTVNTAVLKSLQDQTTAPGQIPRRNP